MVAPKALADETCRLLSTGKIREPAARGTVLTAPPRTGTAAASSHQHMNVHVISCGSFEAAQWLYRSRACSNVCVLDFASDSEPGGGWRGNQIGTQEENLCRASSLGRALERLPYPIPTYGAAHVPEVIVFRNASGELAPHPFRVGVLAACLRDIGGNGEPDAKQRAHLESKVSGVLSIMASFGYDGIILGAWGCGAFGNPPALVAQAFAKALSGAFAGAFAEVAFPVLRQPARGAFLEALQPLGASSVALHAASVADGESASAQQAPLPPRRGLSAVYGPGASAHEEAELLEWQECGLLAQEAVRERDWATARAHFERCVELRPEWAKGHECLARALARERQQGRQAKEGAAQEGAAQEGAAQEGAAQEGAAQEGAAQEGAAQEGAAQEGAAQKMQADGQQAVAGAGMQFKSRVKGVKLLGYERELVGRGELTDVTHDGASAVWLSAESAEEEQMRTLVYRPMGDAELSHLLTHGELPDTQPYQTIVRGAEGRQYAEKYLRGAKWVDSSPTTVVEFVCPSELIEELFVMQCKPEDGALSHGLGDKGGHGLPKFNESLRAGTSRYRIVLVKRGPNARPRSR